MANTNGGIQVKLTLSELLIGANVGIMRHTQNLKHGRQPTHGAGRDNAWQKHISGALGEMAVANALDRYWSGALGDLRAADIGDRVEVRTTPYGNGKLILHKTDPDDHWFFLVTGRDGVYIVRGFLQAAAGKKDKYWLDPGTGRPAYFVPQADLRPVAEWGWQ